MSTREIGSRHAFERVLQKVRELAVSHRVRYWRTPRSEKGTQKEIAKLLGQNRATIALWLCPTTSSISTEKAKAVHERLKDLGKPDLAEIFESSLACVDGYFAGLVHDGIQWQTIRELGFTVREAKFIPLLKAIACDGITPPGKQTGKVNPPGEVFRQKLWEVVNSRRRATNMPLLRPGEAALRPALAEPDICLGLLRVLATLQPRKHAKLGIWPSLTPDQKRKWIQHGFGLLEVTVSGWERHRDDELWHSPEIDDLLERLSSGLDSTDEAKDVPTGTPTAQSPADAKAWDSDTPCKVCGSPRTYNDGFGFSCVECGLWKDGGNEPSDAPIKLRQERKGRPR